MDRAAWPKTWVALASVALSMLLPKAAGADVCLQDDFGIQFQLVKNKTNEGFSGLWTNAGCGHSANLTGSTIAIGSSIYFGWTEYYGPATDCVAADYHGTWTGSSGTGTWYNRTGGSGSFTVTKIPCPISLTNAGPKTEAAGPNAH